MKFDPAMLSPQHRTLAAEVLAVIAKILGSGSSAETAVTVITAIVDHFISATQSKATAEAVRKEMDRLVRALATNDAAADDALAKKFDSID